MEQLGLPFEVATSNINEDIDETDPAEMVEKLAFFKAREVSGQFPKSLIIGADTTVVYSGEILGKPKDEIQANEILMKLSGSIHTVFTGIALILTDKNGLIESKKTFSEQTKVKFSPLTSQEIDDYIKSGSPFDKAGAYGIQDDVGALFVEGIEGDYYNVVGFPLNRFYRELKNFNPELALIRVND